jgi:hypothetical protein
MGLQSFGAFGLGILGTGTIFAALRQSGKVLFLKHRFKPSISTLKKISHRRQIESIIGLIPDGS